jgi:3D (Asp-Asp-Asp) domain-containing protein
MFGRCLLAGALAFVLFATPVTAQESRIEYVHVTFYTLQGKMRWGEYTYKGAAACGNYFPPGTQMMFPDGFVVTCKDTGSLGKTQVDIWAPSWQWGHDNVADTSVNGYGEFAWVTIIRWGWGE